MGGPSTVQVRLSLKPSKSAGTGVSKEVQREDGARASCAGDADANLS